MTTKKQPTLVREVTPFYDIQYIHKVKINAPRQRSAANCIAAFDMYVQYAYEETKKLIQTGADHIVLTGLYTLLEKRAALLGALQARKEAKLPYFKCPILCHITNLDRTRSKHIHLDMDPVETTLLEKKIQTALVTLESLGADGFIFTSSTAAQIENIRGIARQVTYKPIAYISHATNMVLEAESFLAFDPKELGPNPTRDTIEEFLLKMQELAFGGRFILFTVKEFNRKFWDHKHRLAPINALTHANLLVPLGPKEFPVMVGERINPAYYKDYLQNEPNGKIGMRTITHLLREAASQRNAGAKMLNINLGACDNLSKDEEDYMFDVFTKLIFHISKNVDVPLSIDTRNPRILEGILKIYPGKLLINSVAYDDFSIKTLMPLAKKYGAAIVCMPLTEKMSIPTPAERCAIMKDIILEATYQGFTKRDILIDPLVLPYKTHERGPVETVQTLRLFIDAFDCPTIIGLSNISSGTGDKHERSILNRRFLALTLSNGLHAAIMDPFDWDVRDSFNQMSRLLGFKLDEEQDIKIYKLKK